jgi:hypothetical protein
MEEKRPLLHELKLQNDIELDEKRNLDTKASNITNYSVTFTVLFFGVGTFLIEKIETEIIEVFAVLISLLLLGVILSILCVIFSIIAFRLREYRYVMSYDKFFTQENLPHDKEKWYDYFNKSEINAWIDDFEDPVKYEDFMIEEHLLMLKRNTTINDLFR